MEFSEKVNAIFGLLGCTNSQVARAGKVDPSLVSRYRSNSRKPEAGSTQFLNFCGGLAACAEERGLTDKLRERFSLSESKPAAEAIHTFLKPDEAAKKREYRSKSNLPHTRGLFSDKFNSLMKLLDISNIRLARAINVDTSLISRFRKGLRNPSKNAPLLESLCSYFYKTAKLNGLEYELSELLGLPEDKVEAGSEDFLKSFARWLSDTNGQKSAGAIDSFFDKLGELSLLRSPVFPSPESFLPPGIFLDSADEYVGASGIRQAVLRFLGNVAVSQKPHTLKLYSDQKMTWLFSDPDYVQKWAALMYAILKNNNTIKVIHNIERDLDEMLIGIEGWLPLYMSGNIEGYYCKSPYNPRFNHTLFVDSKTAAIEGSFVSGTEAVGLYQYASSPETTAYYESQIDSLLALSRPLIQVFSERTAENYHFCSAELSKAPGEVLRLLLSPSAATMPEALLERILKRCDIIGSEKERILDYQKAQMKQLKNELDCGRVSEYILFPDDEALFSGKVPLNLSGLFAESRFFYTREEFSEHIKAIITLLKNESYNVFPLRDCPFSNIQMAVKTSCCAFVQKTDLPVTVFRFSHPLMCKAISEYIDAVRLKNRMHINVKYELIAYLSKFIL